MNKVILITGAKGGLGTAVTEAFLKTGATVAGVSRSIQPADFPHPAFHAFPADLTTGSAARKLVHTVVASLQRIDVLAHVMGGFAGGQSVAETDDETIDRMLDMNYRSAFFIVRAVLPIMQRQRSGRILAVASRQGIEPSPMVAAYSASKAALVSLIHTVALETRTQGISANTVLPGTMDTPGNRAGDPGADTSRWVQPSQVAALLVHLASDDASQITGAAIPIFGSQ